MQALAQLYLERDLWKKGVFYCVIKFSTVKMVSKRRWRWQSRLRELKGLRNIIQFKI